MTSFVPSTRSQLVESFVNWSRESNVFLLILVSAYEDEDFARLCRAIGRAELARLYKTHDVRVRAESQREIYKALEEWTKDKTKEQAAQVLDRANIVNQPVWNAKEVASHPHWQERGSIFWMDDPNYGDLLSQGSPFKMSETPPRVKWSLKPIGADNEAIYSRLCGLTADEIKQLETDEVI